MKVFRIPLIVLVLGLVTGQASGGISISLEPASTSVAPGDPVDMALKISGLGDGTAPSISTFDMDVTFDSSILGYTGASFGDPVLGDQLDLFGFGSIASATPSPGSVNLFELSLDFPSDLDDLQAGAFTLVTLSFDAVSPGTSLLSISPWSLGDSLGDPLDATYTGGSVSVVPLPGAFLLTALGFGSAGWALKRRSRMDE